jgi:Cu(I)/Ag(I) efflux system membrane fusion protein
LPLVIPATAPLLTGTRAVVYIAVPGEEGVYEGRDVVLGPRAGPYYLVREGLEEGDLVVVNGAFKIDSSLQIQGKPSMMAPESGEAAPLRSAQQDEGAPALDVPESFRGQVNAVLEAVLFVSDALAGDDMLNSRLNATHTRIALGAVDMTVLSPEAHDAWMKSAEGLTNSLDRISSAATIDEFRTAFSGLANAMEQVLKTFGPVRADPIYVMHCPMAFENKGANWLQRDDAVRNPYFGKAMFSCGEVISTVAPAVKTENPGHE